MSGPWAVVTGASSGIGRAIAIELAARGYNLFLCGRDEAALRATAAGCEGRETRIHVADLADAAQTESLIAALAEVDCALLVNNAGFGVKGNFAGTDLGAELALMRVQLDAAVRITKALLPGMLERGHGRFLNVASVYSFSPVPRQAVYAACKAFLMSFGAALHEELRGTGVTVTTVCPGVTRTGFRARAGIGEKSSKSGSTPEAVARMAIARTLDGRTLAVPRFVNKLFVYVMRRLPFALVPRLMNLINNRRGVNAPRVDEARR